MQKVMRVVGFLFFATFFVRTAHAQSAPLFRFDQKPGPYAVGLKVVQQYDYSRPSLVDAFGRPVATVGARPLQTLIWYPAKKTGAKPITVADYANLLAAETNFDHPKIDERAKSLLDAMAPTLTTALWAVRDAPAESARFPVIIYAPSFSATAWENADLCEYLATHGYVVIASPDMGSSTRAMTPDLDGVRTQARDIDFLIGYAQGLPNTNMSSIAVGGFSWGGISNLFAAAGDNRIRALFALDGSMRYFPGLVKKSGEANPEQMTIPLLFFTAGAWTKEMSERLLPGLFPEDYGYGPNVLNAWTHGDLIVVDMLGMTHQEFSSMFQRNEQVWKMFPQFQLADYGRDSGIPEYAWMARYTLAFLDAYLSHDSGAMEFLKKTPAENGVPAHFMATSYRAATGIAPSWEAFRSELGRQGYEHAPEIYASLQKQGFKLEESKLNSWGYELMAMGAMPEAISILKLQVQLYPNEWNPYDSLAEAYMKSGNKQLAIENYQKSLQLNPDNEGAKQKLRELGAKSGNS